jgi:hypothetical protein
MDHRRGINSPNWRANAAPNAHQSSGARDYRKMTFGNFGAQSSGSNSSSDGGIPIFTPTNQEIETGTKAVGAVTGQIPDGLQPQDNGGSAINHETGQITNANNTGGYGQQVESSRLRPTPLDLTKSTPTQHQLNTTSSAAAPTTAFKVPHQTQVS